MSWVLFYAVTLPEFHRSPRNILPKLLPCLFQESLHFFQFGRIFRKMVPRLCPNQSVIAPMQCQDRWRVIPRVCTKTVRRVFSDAFRYSVFVMPHLCSHCTRIGPERYRDYANSTDECRSTLIIAAYSPFCSRTGASLLGCSIMINLLAGSWTMSTRTHLIRALLSAWAVSFSSSQEPRWNGSRKSLRISSS